MQEPQEADGSKGPDDGEGPAEGVGDALRTAVERTLAVTADSATGTRQRAQSLVDDVVRRGQEARDQVTRRGEEATSRLAEAISELRTADDADLEELRTRLAAVEQRLAAMEARQLVESNPLVEGEGSSSEPLEQKDSGG